MPRTLPWDLLSQAIVAFFVTRQIYCGAGKYGWEDEDRFLRPSFQVSQRSDFFSELQSVDTMQRRPIVNTRDEPHADNARYRRFHVIIGDSNLSLYANHLKIGTTALVLQALLNGAPLERIPVLADPLAALKQVSRDTTWKWLCRQANGKSIPAVDIQRVYLQLVREFCPSLSPDWEVVAREWEEVLDDLEHDPLATADRLDWTAKYKLIEGFRAVEKIDLSDPWLRSLDLAYHLLDREQGLFYGLMDQGAFRFPCRLEEITGHSLCPPSTTRAAVRGRCVEKFGAAVTATQWDYIMLQGEEKRIELDLRNLFDPQLVRQSLKVIHAAQSVEDLAQLPFAKVLESV